MAKKTNDRERPKSIEEMSDYEFIVNADSLSSPYYRAYMARACVDYKAGEDNAPDFSSEPSTAAVPADKKSKGRVQVKKRTPILIILAVLLLASTIFAFVGFFNVSAIDSALNLYDVTEVENGAVTPADLIVGMFDKDETKSVFRELCLTPERLQNADFMKKVALYSAPIAALIILLVSLYGFFKAVAAIFTGKKGQFCHRFKFGFLTIVLMLCGLILFFGGLYALGVSLADALDFFGGKLIVTAGAELYIFFIFPIVSFVLGLLAYKKY